MPVSFKVRQAGNPRLGAAPFVVGLGTMLLAAHVSGVTAVFPYIASRLRVGVTSGQGILTGYTLALSACLLTFGSLADRIGLVPVYIGGMVIYGISSGLCALASSAWVLILLRSIQGIGAAMVSATSVALLGTMVTV